MSSLLTFVWFAAIVISDTSHAKTDNLLKIALLVHHGCFASTAHGLIDAFSCASHAALEIGQDTSFEALVVSLDGHSVLSSSQFEISVSSALGSVTDIDALVVVPWIYPTATEPEVDVTLSPLQGCFPVLRELLEQGVTLASSCTGAFLLAEAGLLDGKFATTHWRAADVFRRRYPAVTLQAQDLITDNGSLMCGGGAASYVDLALHIIRRFGGASLAAHCAHTLVVDPGRNLQSPYAVMQARTDHGDLMVNTVQDHIAKHFADVISVQGLAEECNVSERTLARRFKGATDWPIGLYIQNTRIEAARTKLATTAKPLQTIVAEVGYEDFSSFARLFKNRVGLTMQSFRDRFRHSQSPAS